MLRNIFLVLLALCAAWPFHTVGHNSRAVITRYEVLFSPKFWDYWYGEKVEYTKRHIPLRDSRFHILKFFKDDKDDEILELEAVEDPIGTYFVVAVATLYLERSFTILIWRQNCDRQPKNKYDIEKKYYNAYHHILVDSTDERIQFECPNGKRHANISLKPRNQSEHWTPVTGKLKLFHLRTNPFYGYRLLFPSRASSNDSPSSEVMKASISNFFKTLATTKRITSRICNLVRLSSFFVGSMVAQYGENHSWITENMNLFRQAHPQLLAQCNKIEIEQWPVLYDFFKGLRHSFGRCRDFNLFILQFNSYSEFDCTPLDEVGNRREIAHSIVDEKMGAIHWFCTETDVPVDSKLNRVFVYEDEAECKKTKGRLSFTAGKKVSRMTYNEHLPEFSVLEASFSGLDQKDEKAKTARVWQMWGDHLKSLVRLADYTSKEGIDFRSCGEKCRSLEKITERMRKFAGGRKKHLSLIEVSGVPLDVTDARERQALRISARDGVEKGFRLAMASIRKGGFKRAYEECKCGFTPYVI